MKNELDTLKVEVMNLQIIVDHLSKENIELRKKILELEDRNNELVD